MKKIIYTSCSRFKGLVFFVFISLFYAHSAKAQHVPSKDLVKDTTKVIESYPFIFPAMGEKVNQLGFKLPYPHGIMANVLYGIQDVKLSDLYVGINDNPLIPLDSIVRFETVTADAVTYNIRLDTWILPFLNVYGIFGLSKANTTVKIAEPIELQTNPETGGEYLGIGALFAGAIGPAFFSWDVNKIWLYTDKLDTPAKVLTTGIRSGPTFKFKNRKEMNVVLWGGIMYSHLNGETNGRIGFKEVFPGAPGKIDEIQTDLDGWYNDLTLQDQLKYKIVYERISQGLDDAKTRVETSSIRYEMQKSFDNPWNLIVGGQWQINYRWQFRTEAQLLGDRTAGLFSLNYRFGLRGRNLFSGKKINN